MPKVAIFGEKTKISLFYSFFSIFQYKNQKILMRGFSGKWARTHGRMNGGESKGPPTPSRDQKWCILNGVPLVRHLSSPNVLLVRHVSYYWDVGLLGVPFVRYLCSPTTHQSDNQVVRKTQQFENLFLREPSRGRWGQQE